jgi:hypothetical protein
LLRRWKGLAAFCFSKVMAENTSSTSWWEKVADKLKDLGGAAVNAYDTYTGAKKTEAETDEIENQKPIDWAKVGIIAGIAVIVLGGLIWLMSGRKGK